MINASIISNNLVLEIPEIYMVTFTNNINDVMRINSLSHNLWMIKNSPSFYSILLGYMNSERCKIVLELFNDSQTIGYTLVKEGYFDKSRAIIFQEQFSEEVIENLMNVFMDYLLINKIGEVYE